MDGGPIFVMIAIIRLVSDRGSDALTNFDLAGAEYSVDEPTLLNKAAPSLARI